MRLQLHKERLNAFVVHDLKNPVNALDLHAQLLLRDPSLSPSARESAGQIRSQARRLTRMIRNLLDLAKADEGQLSPKPSNVNLRALVGDVLGELGVTAGAQDVSLRCAIETDHIHGDEDLLRRTLTNLVENAIRHAPSKTSVTVSAQRLAGAVQLRVSDAGIGIPPQMRHKIFDPFVQVASSDSSATPGGHGLGLAFCKLAVDAHGGRIWVEDGSPGAIFCVSLPYG
jgi:signal transduction histidine kinase